QVIATAQASFELTAVALIIVVVINVLLVWLPIVFHLVAPALATRYLTAFNRWLRAHGKLILLCVLVAGGGVLGCQRDLRARGRPMTTRRRITDPVEQLAQRIAERVVELVLSVLDVNALLAQVDVNAVLARVDVAALLNRVDLNAVLAQVDIGAL